MYVNYSYLRDRLYLVLLYRYNEKKLPSFSALAEEWGFSRQTVAKRFKMLEEEEIAVPIGGRKYTFVDFLEEEDITREEVKELLRKNYTDNQLGMILLSKIRPETYEDEVHIMLDIGASTLDKKFRKDLFVDREIPPETEEDKTTHTIYGIIYGNRIKYVGYTDDYVKTIERLLKQYQELHRDSFLVLRQCGGERALYKSFVTLIKPEFNK